MHFYHPTTFKYLILFLNRHWHNAKYIAVFCRAVAHKPEGNNWPEKLLWMICVKEYSVFVSLQWRYPKKWNINLFPELKICFGPVIYLIMQSVESGQFDAENQTEILLNSERSLIELL